VLLCICLPWQPAQAAGKDWWLRPDQQQHARMEHGVEAYRKNDFSGAEKNWSGLPGADAAYNRGNALAKAGDYDAAIAAYDEALRRQPGMEDAIANKRAVEAEKKRKPPSGQKQGNQNQKQKGDRGKPQNGENQRGQAQQPGQSSQARNPRQAQPPQSSKPEDGGQQAKPDKPTDTAAQRAADAAQRERMQRALQQAKQGQSQAQAMQRSETPAERERRLANEAWLRRVPDDPGGLLRAKFRLEYERRQQGGN
jgi:Ca-activated chloride channel family protein